MAEFRKHFPGQPGRNTLPVPGPVAAPDKERPAGLQRSASDDIQEGKKVLKLKAKMADKENIDNTVEKNCIP